jgi:hypothetical protein
VSCFRELSQVLELQKLEKGLCLVSSFCFKFLSELQKLEKGLCLVSSVLFQAFCFKRFVSSFGCSFGGQRPIVRFMLSRAALNIRQFWSLAASWRGRVPK